MKKKSYKRPKCALIAHHEHITQTADNTIFYLAKGFEELYLECYRNPTKTSSYIEDHTKDSLTRDPCVS